MSFTSIGSLTDEVVFPQPRASMLPGAANIMLQDICPLRTTDHGLLLGDAVAYDLVLDALTHSGPAAPSRINRSICLQQTLPGADLVAAAPFLKTVAALGAGLADARTFVDAEPPLPAYAEPYGGLTAAAVCRGGTSLL